jgi:HD-GYP domain-containing protein (c-di-GMP phosphodiesterase class II)
METYLHYLRAKLKGKVNLVATDDVEAQPEGVVAKRGDIIDQKTYRNLSRFKLVQPLESHLQLEEIFTPNIIYTEINQLVDDDESFSAIDQHFGKGSVLEQCTDSLKQYPELLEVLTIFKIEAQEYYEQSLLSAYLSYIIGLIAKYPQEKIEAAFFAGLFHDIGLLFIPRNCLDKTKRLTAKEWHDMQLHPIVAFKLLKDIEAFPNNARKAVLEHHERPDGSGYPIGKEEDDITELGSLISLLDDVIVIHNKRFKPLGRSIQNILPIIQMNTFGYETSVVSAMTQAIKQAPPPVVEDIEKDTVKILVDYTYQQQLFINKIMDVINQVNEIVGFTHNSKSVTAIQNTSKKITSVIASSGLQESSYVELLQRLNTEDHQHLHLEVEQTRLMLEEVIYQLQGYYKEANVYSNEKSNTLAEKIQIFVDVFNATERPPIPEELVQYWQHLSEKTAVNDNTQK